MLSNLKEKSWGLNLIYFVKWSVISVLFGIIIGALGALLARAVIWATSLWNANPLIMLLLPVSGVIIVTLYKLMKEEKNTGTNLIIDSVSNGRNITIKTAPLIFSSTILTQITGGSMGKEGAALQLGGSLGALLAGLFKVDKNDKKICIMCGMSACFGAVFRTPLAAGFFSMEVIRIGSICYAALIPCMFASFVGSFVAGQMGIGAEILTVNDIPQMDIKLAALAALFGILAALVSILFCKMLYKSTEVFSKLFKNAYVRIIVGGLVFLTMTYLNQRFFSKAFDFNGGGFPLIKKAMEGKAVPYAFIFKILFTSLALGVGFKGGEIVPTLCVGATFGSLFAQILGMDPILWAACGMAALFVGVTNCPVTTIFLAFELFGFAGMPYYAIVIAVCFTLSGYYGLYNSQNFVFSKIKAEYIDKNSN